MCCHTDYKSGRTFALLQCLTVGDNYCSLILTVGLCANNELLDLVSVIIAMLLL